MTNLQNYIDLLFENFNYRNEIDDLIIEVNWTATLNRVKEVFYYSSKFKCNSNGNLFMLNSQHSCQRSIVC
jgi:hypothetical protein